MLMIFQPILAYQNIHEHSRRRWNGFYGKKVFRYDSKF
jgi:hypothetical protein